MICLCSSHGRRAEVPLTPAHHVQHFLFLQPSGCEPVRGPRQLPSGKIGADRRVLGGRRG